MNLSGSSPEIKPAERRWAAAWSTAILILSCLPYLIAAWIAPEGWQFAGILVNPLDGQSYMAKMQQGAAGRWLFHLTYTPEPHDGAFIFTFYLALGHLAALTGLPKILIFHLARLLAGFWLLWVVFRFIARVTTYPAERRLAFVLIVSASGLGWLGVIFGAFPIDLWVPEAFTPYSLYANPHFPLAMTLMLIIFEQITWPTLPPPQSPISTLRGHSLSSILHSLSPALTALALAMILPFALLTTWAILIVFLGWSYAITRRLPWQLVWSILAVILFSAPVILYQYWVSTTNPILAGWGAQNLTPAPPLGDFALGYGLVGLFALVGTGLIISKGWTETHQGSAKGEWLLLCWAATTIVLVYFPFELQRRLLTGLHLPLCILAALGLSRWSMIAGYRRLLAMSVVVLSALGTLFVWGLLLLGALQSPAQSATTALMFIRRDEIAALEGLRVRVQPDDVILTSPRLGLFIPGQTGARSFYGHPFETIEAKTKEAQVLAFYRGEIEAVSPPADYFIYGPSEQALGQPKKLLDYPVVFSTGDVAIYKLETRK
jgi:hypothetical protein